MIHTMWRSVDDYMVMYLIIGKKDDAMRNNPTLKYGPFFVFLAFSDTLGFEGGLEVKT